MKKDLFEKLVDKEKTQVFLFTCPAHLIFSFAVHPWFVINERGALSRWEVLHRDVKWKTKWGHLYRDIYSPFRGIEVISPSSSSLYWKPKLVAKLEGGDAIKMAKVIKESPQIYPYSNSYSYTGPNSNTYAQWVLDQFKELNVKLPLNAFGKKFK